MDSQSSESLDSRLLQALGEARSIVGIDFSDGANGLDVLSRLSQHLRLKGYIREANAILDTYHYCHTEPDFGGLGLSSDGNLTKAQIEDLLFFASAYLEALNSQDRAVQPPDPLSCRPAERRGMTLAEKILASHDVSGRGEVRAGDVIRIHVDWIIASELSWSGMEHTYDRLGSPGIFRNDRLWIAGDHVVDPRVYDNPRIKPLIEASERARRVFKMTENQGMNYTIMHTEFCRERAQPGMLVIGSDSHTCSAGSVSSLAIGLGVADVTLPLVTGETWIKVPETVEIRLINRPRPGIGGKDVILYILKELKRNTVAADRVVEYTGPGLMHMSCDARFALCNMATEFGAVTGICVPDEVTKAFIDRRKHPKHKDQAHYYRPDADAQYAESHTIDLHNVEAFVARYPSPDDVVPVAEMAGTQLDGCFIGACTTTREDLILAALVLEAGLNSGVLPVSHGKRKVVPGSRPILHELRKLGLAAIYEKAGFEIGVPSCSYCVGMSVDKADPGEVWLSSQNRNFKNRMGPGAIGSITSAVVVAASSFHMKISDPTPLIDAIDMDRLQSLMNREVQTTSPPDYVEPSTSTTPQPIIQGSSTSPNASPAIVSSFSSQVRESRQQAENCKAKTISGKIQVLGDFIDTDALAPSESLIGARSAEEFGSFCLYHTHPHFRQRVKEGFNIVVAGKAFGVGSSRENAVTALMGCGVQCVIARSFAFIYSRNQPNLGLLGIVMEDETFYACAVEGADIELRVHERTILVNGRHFTFSLSDLEIRLWEQGGLSPAFAKWGKQILERMTAVGSDADKRTNGGPPEGDQRLQW